MKKNPKAPTTLRRIIVTFLLSLACSIETTQALDDRIIGTFDADIEVTDGSYNPWPEGSSDKTLEWSNEDADGNPNSGSLKATVNWNGKFAGWNDSKVVFKDASGNDFAWPGIDCRNYVNVEWDVKVDVAKSNTADDGTFGMIQVVGQGWEGANGNPAGLGWVSLGNAITVTNKSGWQHMKQSLLAYPYNLNKLVFSLVVNPGKGTITYLIDNVKLTAPPQPPPTLSTEKAIPGVEFIAASSGQWDRQNIRTIGTNYSWLGRKGSVSYSVDIARQASVQGFRSHMFLVPGISNPSRSDSDWHETNCLMVAIYSNPAGSATASIHCKVNAPDNNGRQFEDTATGGGNLGGITSTKGVGTWTLTFSQDSNIILTAPDGSGLTNTIPAEIIDVWKTYPTMQFAVGVMPGNPAFIGQKVNITGIRINGTAAPDLDANFITGKLDTNSTWSIVAASPTYGVQQMPSDAVCWINWTLPASGFRLQATPLLGSPSWKSVTLSGFNAGDMRYGLLRKGELPFPDAGFFRLIKSDYSKLLILLPGETAAPGTPTGKTGTPTSQQAGQPFDITVKAVDVDWFPISGIDHNIRIKSTDEFAMVNWGYLPLDTTLVNGVFNSSAGSCSFSAQGNWTFRVEDTTNPAITVYTSAPVKVTP